MIRKATVDDIKQLASLYKELMIYHHKLDPVNFIIPDEGECENKIKEKMELEQFFSIICHETDGLIDGCAIYLALPGKRDAENSSEGSVILYDLIVSEISRQRGIGTELINEVIRIAKENGCSSVVLDVNNVNIEAQKFYEKIGFTPTTIQMRKRL